MKKKTPALRFPKPKTAAPSGDRSWHNGADVEILLYVRALREAARTVIETMDMEAKPGTAWNACPVILLYREAVELQLKALIGEGGNFLLSPVDPLTLSKTRSLRWLAQIVCQIIRGVEWEKEFQCEGVAALADFSAMIDELEALNPVACAVRAGNQVGAVPHQLRPPNIVRFATKLDSLLNLLNATADALAATWDLRNLEEVTLPPREIGKPTIH